MEKNINLVISILTRILLHFYSSGFDGCYLSGVHADCDLTIQVAFGDHVRTARVDHSGLLQRLHKRPADSLVPVPPCHLLKRFKRRKTNTEGSVKYWGHKKGNKWWVMGGIKSVGTWNETIAYRITSLCQQGVKLLLVEAVKKKKKNPNVSFNVSLNEMKTWALPTQLCSELFFSSEIKPQSGSFHKDLLVSILNWAFVVKSKN